jgi:hypothetical protein
VLIAIFHVNAPIPLPTDFVPAVPIDAAPKRWDTESLSFDCQLLVKQPGDKRHIEVRIVK